MMMRKNRKPLNPPTKWTKQDEALIIKLWEENYTGYQIAQILKTTRSAILGKLSRMRDSGVVFKREKTVAIKKEPKPKTPYVRPTHKPAAIPKEEQQNKALPPKVLENPTCKPIPFSKLTNKTCKYSVSGNLPADYMFCGAPVHKQCLCEYHYKICYTVRGKTNDTAKSSNTRNHPSREGLRTHTYRLRP